MAYTRPDVYIEEILTPDTATQGISTSIAAFVGAAQRGPANTPIFIDSFSSFKRTFGGVVANESMYYSVRSFFDNGGAGCYIVRVADVSATEGLNPTVIAANEQISADAGSAMLKFSAGYRGKYSFGPKGKDLSVRIRLNSSFVSSALENGADGAVGDTSIKVTSSNGLIAGDIIKVTSTEGEVFLKVAGICTAVELGFIVCYVDLSSPLGAVITAAGSSVDLLAYDVSVIEDGEMLESFNRLSMNPDSDQYFETVINDEQVGSRFILVEDLELGTLLSNSREIAAAFLNGDYDLQDNGEDELAGVTVADDIIAGALPSLEAKGAVNLLCVPPSLNDLGIIPVADIPLLHAGMLEFCGDRMDMFAILDAPKGLSADATAAGSVGEYRKNTLGVDTYWGALYFPHIRVPVRSNSTQLLDIPPSGAVAGLFARVDSIPAPRGGISTAPAGNGEYGLLRGVSGTTLEISDAKHGDLNVIGVNCIRVVERGLGSLPGAQVLGARTLSSTLDFRYVNVRRMMTFIEKNVKAIGEDRLFRNNGPQLWSELTNEITSFLTKRHNLGELAGTTANQAFYVKIDSETNTADNIRQGILVGEIGVALLRPAEFVIFRFSQIQAN
jgi:hypothetical protein